MMKKLQKLGSAMMLPVAALPICGILMGLGYLLCPSTMQGGNPEGFVQILGFFLVKAGAALIDNMAILFAIGVGVGLAKDNDGTADAKRLMAIMRLAAKKDMELTITIDGADEEKAAVELQAFLSANL